MAQVDININLYDTGYSLRADQGDGSADLGTVGLVWPKFISGGVGGYSSFRSEANFPRYNSKFGAVSEPTTNELLEASAKTPYAESGVLPANVHWGFDGTRLLQIKVNNAGVGSTIEAKYSPWPGVIDYTNTGAVALTITSPRPLSFGGLFPVIYKDGSTGFVIWGVDLNTFGNVLLPIYTNLATPTNYIVDSQKSLGGQITITVPWNGLNYQADLTSAPDIVVTTTEYDSTIPAALVVNYANSAPLTLPADCANALNNPNGVGTNGQFQFSYAPDYIFGIDWASGNNTGCWYCKYDLTAFGKVTFTMDDASIGPSSDPTVYWVWDLLNFGPLNPDTFWFYPEWSLDGSVFWIRAPLTDGAGNMVLEALTGEVYSSVAPASGVVVTFIPSPPLVPPVITLPFCVSKNRCVSHTKKLRR